MLIEWHSGQEKFTLNLPWVSLEIEVTSEDHHWVKVAIDNLYQDSAKEEVQKFLKFFEEYNVYYIKPRHHKDSLIPLTPEKEKLPNKQTLDLPINLIHWISDPYSLSFEVELASEWQWDLEEIYKISAVEGSPYFDPLSVVSFLKGKMLEIDAQGSHYRQGLPGLLDELRKSDEAKFFAFMRTLIKQTHYITQHFQQYSPLSLKPFAHASEEIKQFIAEERGHDKLMEASLGALGTSPEELDPFQEIVFLMEGFRKAAELSPLAFTLMIGFFEGENYGYSDPLADVLKASSKPKAGLGYERHFEINKSENHNQVINNLAEKLNLQTKNQVAFTTRLLELISAIGSGLDKILATQVENILLSSS